MTNEEDWMEAEMMAENTGGKPVVRTPEEGIKIMQTRLRILRKREKHIRTGDHFTDEALRENSLIQIGREIRDAQGQLKHFQTQLKCRN
jgi:hypothetical protein